MLTVEKNGARLIVTTQDLWNGGPSSSGTFGIAIPHVTEYYAATGANLESGIGQERSNARRRI